MFTRKMLPVSLGLLLIAAPALAQIEVTPMLGWTYGGNFRDAYYGNTQNPITNEWDFNLHYFRGNANK